MTVAGQDSAGGQRARHRRDDHPWNAERQRQLTGVESAGPAESYQRELSRILAAFDRDDAQGALHVGVHHAHYALRKLLQRHARALLLEPLGW